MELWHDRILVLDFGSQYTQLIARRIREAQVYSQILPCTVPLATILAYRPQGIVLSGGPPASMRKRRRLSPKELFDQSIPILGICYGMQLVTHLSGRRSRQVEPSRVWQGRSDDRRRERSVQRDRAAAVRPTVWMSHGDRIERMPPGFRSIAHTSNSPVAAMKRDDHKRRDLLSAVPSGSRAYAGRGEVFFAISSTKFAAASRPGRCSRMSRRQ